MDALIVIALLVAVIVSTAVLGAQSRY